MISSVSHLLYIFCTNFKVKTMCLLNNADHPVICGVGIVITCLKRLHDRIISLTGRLVHKKQFHHVTFIEVIVPIQKSAQSCIYVREGHWFCICYDCSIRFQNLSQCYIFLFFILFLRSSISIYVCYIQSKFMTMCTP